MSIYFGKEFFDHLSETLDVDSEKIKEAFDCYSVDRVPLSKSKAKCSDVSTSKSKKVHEPSEEDDTKKFIKSSVEKASSKKAASKSSHTCERIPRGKSEPCGKPAKNSIDVEGEEKWYCGSEKVGCYHSVLSSVSKVEKGNKAKKVSKANDSDEEKKPAKQVTKQPAKSPKKTQAEIKSQSLIHKIIKKDNIVTRTILVKGDKLHIHPESRVLFRRDGVAYGELHKDNVTILPISDSNVRWLESCNTKIEQISKNERSDEESEEEELDEVSHSESEEDDIDLDDSESEESDESE